MSHHPTSIYKAALREEAEERAMLRARRRETALWLLAVAVAVWAQLVAAWIRSAP